MENNIYHRIGHAFTLLIVSTLFLIACGGGSGSDDAGNESRDTTPPVITLVGASQYQQEAHRAYVEPGAIANDDTDGSVSVTITGFVNTTSPGTYILTYSATDAAGNSATLTRTVDVIFRPFITTWKTDNPGASDDNTIELSTNDATFVYNYTVDWGDGTIDNNVTGDTSHTYTTVGTYTVQITGDFPAIDFVNSVDKEKLLSVDQWGSQQWQYMEAAFAGCTNMQVNATDAPNLSMVDSLAMTFASATSFNQSINHWDVSTITNLSGMFSIAVNFNQPLDNWDVSNVTRMSTMFWGASNFNQPLNNWNVSNVTEMNQMFDSASSFNQPLDNWNVSNVLSMNMMFSNANSFNQPLNNWNVINVNGMEEMFMAATSFNQPLDNWNVENTVLMRGMFLGATSFDQPIGNWTITNVIDMTGMFTGVTLSTTNYNDLLIGWGAQAESVQTGVAFDAGSSTYTGGFEPAEGRAALVTKGWTITDGGPI